MLAQLTISNFAIIRKLSLSFKDNFTVISGETGTGKSIIIHAINLICGGRVSVDSIRSGCDEARIEALFYLPNDSPVMPFLKEMGIPCDEELLIQRIIHKEGPNKIFINGTMATLQMLSRIGPMLISVTGQHEHQLLLKSENHLMLLDKFGGLEDMRGHMAESWKNYHSFHNQLDNVNRSIESVLMNKELHLFQAREIDDTNIESEEDIRLQEEKRFLEHTEELLSITEGCFHDLYERDEAVLSKLSYWNRSIAKHSDLTPEFTAISKTLNDAISTIDDLSHQLRDFRSILEADPDRLMQINDRLDIINKLKRKYGGTIESIQKHRADIASNIYEIDNLEKLRNDLIVQVEDSRKAMRAFAEKLSETRRSVASDLNIAIEKELDDLKMQGTVFSVNFNELQAYDDISITGTDKVDFIISPNIGEELRPLIKIASGGELSRLMLAIRTVLASRIGSAETVVFDEVDAGVSGEAARVVGEKLRSLAKKYQIICITHLPQIACKGDTHFIVEKYVIDQRTESSIIELDDKARVMEIARLLGYSSDTVESAVSHAKEMLKQSA